MANAFELLTEVTLATLGAPDDSLDGPFVMASGAFGFLVSLRGRDGGAMPSPAQLTWRRDLPSPLKKAAAPLFIRRGDRAVYLGVVRLTGRGKLATDGFKFMFAIDPPLDEAMWRDVVATASAPPPPAPEEAIAALPADSTTDQRMAALRVFIERWYGPVGAATLAAELAPPPLRALYELTEGHDVAVQNRIVPRDQLAIDDGKLVFYVENQGVCLWATEPAGQDPPVYVRTNEGGAPWQLEARSLSAFLIQMVVYEATFAAPYGASDDALDARALARLGKRVRPLPLPPWLVSRTRFFGSDGVIGFATAGDELMVWLGARDRIRMEPLDALLEDWSDARF